MHKGPRRRGGWLWAGWFLLLAALTYSPWVAPRGRHTPFLLGLPFTLFWWFLLTLALLLSLYVFVATYWREGER
ncbi:MAG TPA: hypothetical protein VGT06_03930 [Candidatus Methylomirabilis sp.]|jgi:hypothetical protein|nr:hypothetical protein [Candidatus Methylomirabilis sp.]